MKINVNVLEDAIAERLKSVIALRMDGLVVDDQKAKDDPNCPNPYIRLEGVGYMGNGQIVGLLPNDRAYALRKLKVVSKRLHLTRTVIDGCVRPADSLDEAIEAYNNGASAINRIIAVERFPGDSNWIPWYVKKIEYGIVLTVFQTYDNASGYVYSSVMTNSAGVQTVDKTVHDCLFVEQHLDNLIKLLHYTRIKY